MCVGASRLPPSSPPLTSTPAAAATTTEATPQPQHALSSLPPVHSCPSHHQTPGSKERGGRRPPQRQEQSRRSPHSPPCALGARPAAALQPATSQPPDTRSHCRTVVTCRLAHMALKSAKSSRSLLCHVY
uniref:Scybaumancin n=1 Tax=Scylla paramamosain TaxID=85552 RepID=A0AAT9PAT4_SCYPA